MAFRRGERVGPPGRRRARQGVPRHPGAAAARPAGRAPPLARPLTPENPLSTRGRLAFAACLVAVIAALGVYGWPRQQSARVDLAADRQRVEALWQEVKAARAAPDPA